jgi:hypothetical protein
VGRVVNGDIVAPDLKPEYGIFRFAAVSILGRLNLSHYGDDFFTFGRRSEKNDGRSRFFRKRGLPVRTLQVIVKFALMLFGRVQPGVVGEKNPVVQDNNLEKTGCTQYGFRQSPYCPQGKTPVPTRKMDLPYVPCAFVLSRAVVSVKGTLFS